MGQRARQPRRQRAVIELCELDEEFFLLHRHCFGVPALEYPAQLDLGLEYELMAVAIGVLGASVESEALITGILGQATEQMIGNPRILAMDQLVEAGMGLLAGQAGLSRIEGGFLGRMLSG